MCFEWSYGLKFIKLIADRCDIKIILAEYDCVQKGFIDTPDLVTTDKHGGNLLYVFPNYTQKPDEYYNSSSNTSKSDKIIVGCVRVKSRTWLIPPITFSQCE